MEGEASWATATSSEPAAAQEGRDVGEPRPPTPTSSDGEDSSGGEDSDSGGNSAIANKSIKGQTLQNHEMGFRKGHTCVCPRPAARSWYHRRGREAAGKRARRLRIRIQHRKKERTR